MRKVFTVTALIVAGTLATPAGARAQSAILNLPRSSPHARVAQRIGITDITIDYHRPLVSGRQVFGSLQAYGQVWRAGANENTTIEVTDPVTIQGQPLQKGLYGLHMIPGETAWTVIFSKNSTSWGSFTYDPAEDALRVTVPPKTIAHHEALSYDFDDLTPESAVITMRWATVAVAFKVEVKTREIVQRSLRDQLRGRAQFEWQPWIDAASYLLANQLGAGDAATYAEQSIGVEDRFENEFTKALALRVLGRNDAKAAYDKAISLGGQAQIHTFARGLQAQGRQDEALNLFRDNIKKDPTSWVAHNETARLAVTRGDFDVAVTEMQLALTRSPDALKAQHTDLVRRLQHHEDINK